MSGGGSRSSGGLSGAPSGAPSLRASTEEEKRMLYFEAHKKNLVRKFNQGLVGEPPAPYQNWYDISLEDLLAHKMPIFGDPPKSAQEVWDEAVNTYITSNSLTGADADAARQYAQVELEQEVTIQIERKKLRAKVEGENFNPDRIGEYIERLVDTFIAAQEDLTEEEKAEKGAAMKETLETEYQMMYGALEFRQAKEKYFTEAFYRFQQANYPESQREAEWEKIINQFKYGPVSVEINGEKIEKETGFGRGAEDYGWEVFNRYLRSYDSFEEYARRATKAHWLSDLNAEEKKEALSMAYFQEQQELANASSQAELQVRGLMYTEMMQKLDKKYCLVDFIKNYTDEHGKKVLLEQPHFQKYIGIYDGLEGYNTIFANPDADFGTIKETYNKLINEHHIILSSMAPLLRIKHGEDFDPSVVITDLQTLDQEMTSVWEGVWSGLANRSGGDWLNTGASFMVNWNLAIMAKGIIDKVGARHRTDTFSRNWLVPGIPNLGKGMAANRWITAFVAGEMMGAQPIGRTVSALGSLMKRELATIHHLMGAAGGLFNVDFNNTGASLEGSKLAFYNALRSYGMLDGIEQMSDTFGLGLNIDGITDNLEDSFRNGRINDPEYAADFLEDPELKRLLKLAGEAIKLHEQTQQLQRERAVLDDRLIDVRDKLNDADFHSQHAVLATEEAELVAQIKEKDDTIGPKEVSMNAKFDELFGNEQNKERIMLVRSWTKCFGYGLRGAEQNKDGTLELHEHGQNKIWSVLNLAFDEAYAIHTGRDLAKDTALPRADGKSYDDWLLEPDPDNPGRMCRTKFSKRYLLFLIGKTKYKTLEDFIAGDPTADANNPFLKLGIDTGTKFRPTVSRDILRAHVNAHNMAEQSSLSHNVLRFIGLGPGAWILTLMAVSWMIMQVGKNKAWLAAFPGFGSVSLLLNRLFHAHEDGDDAKAETEQVSTANMLNRGPEDDSSWAKDRKDLMNLVFDDPDKPSTRKVKDKVNIKAFVTRLQGTKMTIIPESKLKKALDQADKDFKNDPGSMMGELDPSALQTAGGKLQRLQDALAGEKGIKDVYDALKADLAALSKETDPGGVKKNPLANLSTAIDQDNGFIDNIHANVGQFVSLAQSPEVKAVDISVAYAGGGDDTFRINLRAGKKQTKPKTIKSWWDQDNKKQYESPSKFNARKAGEDKFHGFKILYSKSENSFMIEHNGTQKKIKSITGVSKASVE